MPSAAPTAATTPTPRPNPTSATHGWTGTGTTAAPPAAAGTPTPTGYPTDVAAWNATRPAVPTWQTETWGAAAGLTGAAAIASVAGARRRRRDGLDDDPDLGDESIDPITVERLRPGSHASGH
jgi:hypothetical protein